MNKKTQELLNKYKHSKENKGSLLLENESPIAFYHLKVETLDQLFLIEHPDLIIKSQISKFFINKRYLVLKFNDVFQVHVINPLKETLESVIDVENHNHEFIIPLGRKCFEKEFKAQIVLFYHDNDLSSLYDFDVDNVKYSLKRSNKDYYNGIYSFSPITIKLNFEWHICGPVWVELLKGNKDVIPEANVIDLLLIKEFMFEYQKELINSQEFIYELFKKVIDYWNSYQEEEKDMRWKYSTILNLYWEFYLNSTESKDVKIPIFDQIMNLYFKNQQFVDYCQNHLFKNFPINYENPELFLLFLLLRTRKFYMKRMLKESNKQLIENILKYYLEQNTENFLNVLYYRVIQAVNNRDINNITLFIQNFGELLRPIIYKNKELLKTHLGEWKLQKPIIIDSNSDENKSIAQLSYIHNYFFSPEFSSLPLKFISAFDFSFQKLELNGQNLFNYDNIGKKTNSSTLILEGEIEDYNIAYPNYAFIVYSQCAWLKFKELGNVLILSSLNKINIQDLAPYLNMNDEQFQSKIFPIHDSLCIQYNFSSHKKGEFFICEEIKEIQAGKYFYFIFYENSIKSELIFNSVGVLGFRNEKSDLKHLQGQPLVNPLTRVGFEIRKIIRPYI